MVLATRRQHPLPELPRLKPAVTDRPLQALGQARCLAPTYGDYAASRRPSPVAAALDGLPLQPQREQSNTKRYSLGVESRSSPAGAGYEARIEGNAGLESDSLSELRGWNGTGQIRAVRYAERRNPYAEAAALGDGEASGSSSAHRPGNHREAPADAAWCAGAAPGAAGGLVVTRLAPLTGCPLCGQVQRPNGRPRLLVRTRQREAWRHQKSRRRLVLKATALSCDPPVA